MPDKFLVDDFFKEHGGPACICFIAAATGLDAETIVSRLRRLCEDGKIVARQNGDCVIFEFSPEYRKYLAARPSRIAFRSARS